MSTHEIVWTFDRDRVTQKLVCNDADCEYRYECPEACEIVGDTEKTGTGWRHRVYDGTVDAEVWHPLRKVGYCNVVEWLNNSDGIEELAAGRDTFEIGRTSVEPVWHGEDGAEWKRTSDLTPDT